MDSLTAVGKNGEVSFDGATVSLTRHSTFGKVTSTRTYPIHSLTSVEFKEPSTFQYGVFSLIVSGGNSLRGHIGKIGVGAKMDENAVILEKKHATAFRELFNVMNQAVLDAQRPQPVASASDEITHLAQLHAQGALTDEEFSAAKARLLRL